MKKSQLVFFLLPTLCFYVSLGASSPIDPDDSEDFISCLQSKTNNATSISQLIFTPLNSSFESIWEARVNNLRFIKPSTPRPSVIVTPIDDTQIQASLFCTKIHGYEIRIRSGGHDFEGVSSSSVVPFVMLDLVNMKSIDVDVGNKTAWVQAGALLGEVYYSISQKTNTLYFPAGVCPNVGVGGYMGGGGYGNLVRKYGTAADNVLDVLFMDVNGTILDRKSMGEDLFWALRGGGASSFGIVLAWKLSLVPVPEIVTVFVVNITLEENGTDIFYKYQYVAPRMDPNLLIRVRMSSEFIGNTTKKTIRMLFEGLYLGKIDTLLPLLDKEFPELKLKQENCEEMSMVQSSIVLAIQGFTSSTPTEALLNQSDILRRQSNAKIKLDYVRTPIPKSGLIMIWSKMFENDRSELLIAYTFGGKMEEYSDTAIPYPHRAGVLYQLYKGVSFVDQTSDTTPTSLKRIEWLRSFDMFLEPYVSKNPREAYVNYIDLDLGVGSETYEEASVWGERYWKRENFEKLIRIKAKVDPENVFRHPQSIPVFN
ncbi:putative tetrahydroberberine oxidase [Helianthus annuus]|uniref:Putative berberine/berberine-like, FAD-binding, type 2 n=1 Tax=Helianthus annuus TaxID=4232 RepID=A0A251VLC8_HELAN|nr:tetrahydrocannabinolic acid synthase [Helianthus annuus]KAF5802058.1 putative tetrahydroberberine oxidase [Helianthus annuus]KAJ0560253.1 putative tetrahydroberberine oxidase [Helianthus annuus]KAJ0566520.1 putative tetrahydroberberine oxidase [Helianthus annuus]KAJ0573265.1 putative tetrahydroberberine oxidase [Helianthus annuus]KAJ0911557.1 putative tetrahydroberberine oxidase [Helianthus annuus]